MQGRPDSATLHDDVAALLSAGRMAEALVPAALQADRLGVQPRSLTFLAEIVRRGGIAYAAELAEPMPKPVQTALVRPWLLASKDGIRLARWLDGVAVLITARRLTAR